MLISENVTVDLNETVISCWEMMTTVLVIGVNDVPKSPKVNITSEEFRRNHVKIVFKWPLSDRLISYSVNVISHAPSDIKLNKTSIAELAVQYNTLYRVSVEAVLCSEENTTSSILELYYAKCEHPLSQVDDDSVTVIGYTDLALEGANVTFTCSSGLSDLLPTEPTVSTCMSNGQWSPDPIEVECGGSRSTSDSVVLSRNVIIMCAVSLTVFVVIVFVIGYMLGCASHRLKSSQRTKLNDNQTIATYSEVELAVGGARNETVEQQQQNPEMKENVAYGSLHVLHQ